ncbi:N-acetyltransferase [Paenibacillus sp. J31TS4]|uniref:GNAT family N-acetyltransferase n=1 Tax=Paenibacillus sp. J31TS4 TaxID=2807195 RepID=UPI001B13C5E1|nr:GNAT family N-acetyltransferase [Paenibacillus sp. J31TS4]GIP37648.1 N-acetyltransferase [Paenibacillus sp. J31TS4]
MEGIARQQEKQSAGSKEAGTPSTGGIPGVAIREARQDDYDAVAGLMRQAQRDHAEALPDRFAATDHVLPQAWYLSFFGRATRCILVAEQAEAVVGFAMLEWHDAAHFPALTKRRYAHISEFAVDEERHRQGIGTALFEACREWAAGHGAQQLELKVWEFNEGARSFYEAVGLRTLNRTMTLDLPPSADEPA